MKIYFITGASGTGKSTMVDALRKTHGDWIFYQFDSMGIPSSEKMIEECGSVEKWQMKRTEQWIGHILDKSHENTVVFEGQVDISFIHQAFQKNNYKNYEIILLDCNRDEMNRRLVQRNQPELQSEQMDNWLSYLRNQAKEQNIRIIDSSERTIEEIAAYIESIIEAEEE